MNSIYIGDRPLDPPEDDDFEDGLTEAERQQKAFDELDPEDNDFEWGDL